jgi:hypothetical protein
VARATQQGDVRRASARPHLAEVADMDPVEGPQPNRRVLVARDEQVLRPMGISIGTSEYNDRKKQRMQAVEYKQF